MPYAPSTAARRSPRHPVECQDGTTLSVQVGSSTYCTPRNDEGPYTAVEVGFVTHWDGATRRTMPAEWLDYAEDGTATSDVFGYVPVFLVEHFIQSCGGRRTWS